MDKKDGKKNQKLPAPNQLDTVSPATRLLEKRRLMHEQQEIYEQRKKENKDTEAKFKDQEKDLRKQDMLIQESMIKFSMFLQENTRKKDKAAEKLKQEEELIREKENELNKKKELLKILEAKSERIEKKREAIKQYEVYLEEVRAANPDEYQDLADILSRFQTLEKSNNNLEKNLQVLEGELEKLKKRVTKYDKDLLTQIMGINNDITTITTEYEKIETERNVLKSEAEETNSKKWNKFSELARILFAVNNLEQRCYGRKEKSQLRYQLQGQNEQKNFDLLAKRSQYAKTQLQFIEQYLTDFKAIVANILAKNPGIAAKMKEQDVV